MTLRVASVKIEGITVITRLKSVNPDAIATNGSDRIALTRLRGSIVKVPRLTDYTFHRIALNTLDIKKA